MDNQEKYPIPPDLTRHQYLGGFKLHEIGIIFVLAAIPTLILTFTGWLGCIPLYAVVVAVALMMHRRDNGYGYVAGGRWLWVMLRYNFSAALGKQQLTHRRMFGYQITKEVPQDGQEKP